VTAQVLLKNEIMIGNNMQREMKFTGDVDNQTLIKDVKNYLIGPVYGHAED
jgi:hypothetical protein